MNADEAVRALAAAIAAEAARDPRPFAVMHVCGTHEHTIARAGLRALLPRNVELLAGPGCPVCVTPQEEIARAAAIARAADATLATYGDMVRVPAFGTSLAEERAKGLDLKVVQGPAEAAGLAARAPKRPVIFFSPGFETTAAPVAALLAGAPPANFFVLSAHRLVPPALDALLGAKRARAEALILPGHVLTVRGLEEYRFLPERLGFSAVAAGFEPHDVLAAVLWLLRRRGRAPELGNVYGRAVRTEGNERARALMDAAFVAEDADWRGIGTLPLSGLALAPAAAPHDALRAFPAPPAPPRGPALPAGCRCGEVLLGRIAPADCPLFGKACTPERAVGPCMVGDEGTCRAAWTWRGLDDEPRG
ncbi:MAG TPA: hydrogenase formation protein HypD [Acidobacteriota bacterium]|nr:hydrogenase formation protein HypD [Acidobacteriota bacterium]